MRTRPDDVGLPDGLVVLVASLDERRPAERQTRVVDEDVDAAVGADDIADERLRALPVRHVERRSEMALALELGQHVVEPLDPPGAERDLYALPRERQGGRATDPARGAGDDRRAVGEGGHRASLSGWLLSFSGCRGDSAKISGRLAGRRVRECLDR